MFPSADLATLANDLDQLTQRLDGQTMNELTRIAHGRTPADWVRALHDAMDPAAINAAAEMLAANENGCACSGEEPPAPSATQREEAAARLAAEALAPFVHNDALRAKLQALRSRA
ncbi:MAG TPA: hypothetical protein VIM44_05575 [Rariglobus sp.]